MTGAQVDISYAYDNFGNVIKEEYSDATGVNKVTDSEYVLVYVPYDLTLTAIDMVYTATTVAWTD